MTDSLNKLITELREMEAKASPGPWEAGTKLFVDDYRLIMAARNALPRLLDIIEVQKKALEQIKNTECGGPFEKRWCCQFSEWASEALAESKRMAK